MIEFAERPAPVSFVLKVASRCNLDCTYCYVYNKGDDAWRQRPAVMSDDIFNAALRRIRGYCLSSGQTAVHIAYHGGEPCLVGPDRLARWCLEAQYALADIAEVRFTIQTNGTLLDAAWIDVIKDFDILVGVSLDGPKDVNDAFRIDRRGRGSYDAVAKGVSLLRSADIPLHILSVVQPGADGVQIHRHFVSLGARRVNYLLPDFTHDSISPVRQVYGPTPVADFLLPILDEWWHGPVGLEVGIFVEVSRLILGGRSRVDIFGNRPQPTVFIQSDGAIEALDVLSICEPGLPATGLNVLAHDFARIFDLGGLQRQVLFDGLPLPRECIGCREQSTCAGGYLPHRYARGRGFDQRSVWCEDILLLFGRLRQLLGVSSVESAFRRQVLEEMSDVRTHVR